MPDDKENLRKAKKAEWTKKRSRSPEVKARHAERERERRKRNPEAILTARRKNYATIDRKLTNAKLKKYRINTREKVFAHYGNSCTCCGETNKAFFCIDHINGNGAEDRRQTKRQGAKMYSWLIKHNFPPGFQILCYNCNMAKYIFDVCPHQITSVPP